MTQESPRKAGFRCTDEFSLRSQDVLVACARNLAYDHSLFEAIRALHQRLQLLERDAGVSLPAGEGREAAIGTGNHPFAPDDAGKLLDALRDQFGMLDEIGRRIEDPGIKILSAGTRGSAQTFHSCACRGLEPSKEIARTLALRTSGRIVSSGRS